MVVIPPTGMAQEPPPTFDDLLDAGAQWAQEHIDEDVLRALQNLHLTTVQEFFDNLLERFQSDDVIDIDQLREMAAAALPLLEAHTETQPYAAWLKTREDYFEVAKKLRAAASAPAPEPGRPPVPIPNPPAEQERKVWQEQLAKRAAPAGAEDMANRLKPIFIAHKVPVALVWLAEVESSFVPGARSPSGAAGLYQLMPATARSLGLSLFPTDQRFNPEKNADGAARYLKALHTRFKEWPLALAAYNVGESRVHDLLEEHKARTYDEIATHLPAEAQMYVPKINATLLRREGVAVTDL